MATITGLTAERMLEIEAASVVDGDVVGNDLILAKHDGSIINAGNVRGPAGPTGPMGSALAVVTAQQLLDVGQVGQMRAGRQLTPADFTAMGLNAPLGLWNLSNFNDSSGNGRTLTNKGSVPLGVGINGLASTSAVFAGSTGQVLYIADTGSADPFRIRTGTFGCWLRCAKRGLLQYVMAKLASGGAGASYWWAVIVSAGNTLQGMTGQVGAVPNGTVDICDDQWHFCVAVADGTWVRQYVDGAYDGSAPVANFAVGTATAPVNIGSYGADASTAGSAPFYGRVDEAFITDDVLSEEQIRNLYCATLPHALGVAPKSVNLSIRRRRRGSSFGASDFPAQPPRLHNLNDPSPYDDLGSNAVPTVVQSGLTLPSVAGPDGTRAGAVQFSGVGGYYMSSTDAGLPSGLSPRSYGAWFKSSTLNVTILSWGTAATGARLGFGGISLATWSGADVVQGGNAADGKWHFGVVVEDNAAADGLKRKMYLDGKLVAVSTVLNSLVLGGSIGFRIGSDTTTGVLMNGALARVFVYAGALTVEQVRALYNISSLQLPPSPKNAADHVEAIEAARLLAVFDSIESSDYIDLAVAS